MGIRISATYLPGLPFTMIKIAVLVVLGSLLQVSVADHCTVNGNVVQIGETVTSKWCGVYKCIANPLGAQKLEQKCRTKTGDCVASGSSYEYNGMSCTCNLCGTKHCNKCGSFSAACFFNGQKYNVGDEWTYACSKYRCKGSPVGVETVVSQCQGYGGVCVDSGATYPYNGMTCTCTISGNSWQNSCSSA